MNDTDRGSIMGNAPAAPRRRLRRWTLPLLWLLLACLAAALGPRLLAKVQGGDDRSVSRKPPVALEFTPAEVTRPSAVHMPLVIAFSGPLVAPRTVVVRAKAAGTLTRLNAAEGGRVRRGQTLGEIDIADLRSRVTERSAGVETAQTSLTEAERQHAANVGLAAQNFISSTSLQSSQARLDAARAQVKAAQAQLATSTIGVQDAALLAPLDGIVGKRHVVPGERVAAEQPLLTVVDLSTLELAGLVGTHEVSLIRPGQPVRVQVEGRPSPVDGRIERIAPAAEAGTRAIGVVVVLNNADEALRAGQFAEARLELPDAAPRVTLPASALSQASGQDYVWTLERDTLVRRIVITGRRDATSGRVEVVRGLAADAQVLAARFDGLKEGAAARAVVRRAAEVPPAGVSPSAASAPPPRS